MGIENIHCSSCADGQEIKSSEVEAETNELIESTKDSKLDGDLAEAKVVENMQKIEPREVNEFNESPDLYNTVLEKLDIVEKKQKQDITAFQQESMRGNEKDESGLNKIRNSDQSQAKIQVENAIAQDFDKIQKTYASRGNQLCPGTKFKKGST